MKKDKLKKGKLSKVFCAAALTVALLGASMANAQTAEAKSTSNPNSIKKMMLDAKKSMKSSVVKKADHNKKGAKYIITIGGGVSR